MEKNEYRIMKRYQLTFHAKQLKDPEFIPFIEELLQRTQCNPDWIEFEIIESFIIGRYYLKQ